MVCYTYTPIRDLATSVACRSFGVRWPVWVNLCDEVFASQRRTTCHRLPIPVRIRITYRPRQINIPSLC